MNIKLIAIGKTDQEYLKEGISIFEKRLKHYVGFETKIIPDLKNAANLSKEQQKSEEGKLILKECQNTDLVILLDENGKSYSSMQFSKYLEQHMNNSVKNLVFVIGGPYGFSEETYKRAHGKISLSEMTFSHQMIRLFFVEQLYRAHTIMKGEPYHHE
jgi:23S rRNA (pseudouridine1915-N3)-methyltransferase